MTDSDPYVRGMSAWSAEDDALLDRYKLWQLDLIAPYLGNKVLEIGAGHGRFAKAAQQRHGRFERYVALEPGDHFFGSLQATQAAVPGLEIRNTVINALPPEFSGAFDTVLSIHVMEHD